jgi:hypothetical protein
MPTPAKTIKKPKLEKLDVRDIIEVSEIKHLLLKENKEDLLQIFNLVVKMANKKLNIVEDES